MTDITDKMAREWADRHNLGGIPMSTLRCALDDARSIPELQQAQQPTTILGSTADELFTALEGAHDLGGPAHERVKRLVEQRCVAQQPGAQAVESYWCAINDCGTVEYGQSIGDVAGGESERRTVNDYINDQPNVGELHLRKLYTHPQPPSIPEPSEADAESACTAFDSSTRATSRLHNTYSLNDMLAALTDYTARLRERIGQAPGGDGDA